MPEQETEQSQEHEESSHPFDTEIEVPEVGPADEEAVPAEAEQDDVAEAESRDEEAVTPSEEEPAPAELDETESEPEPDAPARSTAEVMAIAEAIIFVSDEPIKIGRASCRERV